MSRDITSRFTAAPLPLGLTPILLGLTPMLLGPDQRYFGPNSGIRFLNRLESEVCFFSPRAMELRTMNECKLTYDGMSLFLVRDEASLVNLLCDCVLADRNDQILVSGIMGERVHLVGSAEISARLGEEWSIENNKDRTGMGTTSFLQKFAHDVQRDGTLRRIRFCPTAPEYFRTFLAELVACRFGLYIMGFDPRTEPEPGFTREFLALLGAWSARSKGGNWCAKGLVDATDNFFTYSEQRALRIAFDMGEIPTDLFSAAIHSWTRPRKPL